MNRLILAIVLCFVPSLSYGQTLYDSLPNAVAGQLNYNSGTSTYYPQYTTILTSHVFPGAGANGADLVTCIAYYSYRLGSGSYSQSNGVFSFNISSPTGKYYTLSGTQPLGTNLIYNTGATNYIVPYDRQISNYYSSSADVMLVYEKYNAALTALKTLSATNTTIYGTQIQNVNLKDVHTIMNVDSDGGGVPNYAELCDQPIVGDITNWTDDYTCSCGVCCVHECTCGYYWSGSDCNGTTLIYLGCACHAVVDDDRCPCSACCNHSCEQKQTNPEYAKRHYTLVYGLKVECDGTGKTPQGCACHRTCVCGADCFHCCTCSYYQPRDCLGRFKDCSCHQNGILCPCGACCECTCLCGDFPYECLGHATSCKCHVVENPDDPDPDNPCTCEAGCYHCCTCGEFAWDYAKCLKCPCHYECSTCKAKCWHCCTCGNWSGSTDCAGRAIDCDCHKTDSVPDECDCGACCACSCICGNWNAGSCSGFGSDHPDGCRCHDPNDCTCNACCSCTCVCGNWTREECPGVPGYCVCHTTNTTHRKDEWFPIDAVGDAYNEFFETLKQKIGLDMLELLDVDGQSAGNLNFSIEFDSDYLGTGAKGIKKFEFGRDLQAISQYEIFQIIRKVVLFYALITLVLMTINLFRGK